MDAGRLTEAMKKHPCIGDRVYQAVDVGHRLRGIISYVYLNKPDDDDDFIAVNIQHEPPQNYTNKTMEDLAQLDVENYDIYVESWNEELNGYVL